MSEAIDEWVALDYSLFECSDGNILNANIFGDVGATVLFDFGGRYLESLQLAKINGACRIVNKFIVNPKVLIVTGFIESPLGNLSPNS